MNLVGKIVTGLILLLSVVFLLAAVFAVASHQNWQAKARENKELVETLRRQRQSMLAQISEKDQLIEREKAARVVRIQQLESQNQQARQEILQLQVELGDQRVKASENQNIASQNEARLTQLDARVADLQTQLKTVTEDIASQREKVIAMTNQIFELEGEKRSLETIRDGLAAQNATMTKVMKKNGLLETDLTDHIPPIVDGVVTDVRDSVVSLSVGLDDGVRNGHQFDIFRNSQYVGTAQVVDVDANRSVARIDPQLTKYAVQRGDRVTTQWVREQK